MCTEVVEKIPDNFIAQQQLGVAYARVDDHRAAIEAYRAALRIHFDEQETHYHLGQCFLAIGDKTSALAEQQILLGLELRAPGIGGYAQKLLSEIQNSAR